MGYVLIIASGQGIIKFTLATRSEAELQHWQLSIEEAVVARALLSHEYRHHRCQVVKETPSRATNVR